jgi:hypothetical protein
MGIGGDWARLGGARLGRDSAWAGRNSARPGGSWAGLGRTQQDWAGDE